MSKQNNIKTMKTRNNVRFYNVFNGFTSYWATGKEKTLNK